MQNTNYDTTFTFKISLNCNTRLKTNLNFDYKDINSMTSKKYINNKTLFNRLNHRPNSTNPENLNKTYNIKDFLKIRNIQSPLNNSIGNTTYSIGDTPKIEFFDVVNNELAEESTSIYYPNEPKIHIFKQNSRQTSPISQNLKKIKNKTNKQVSFKNSSDNTNNKFYPKPLKNLSELIPVLKKRAAKGKIFRGLCKYTCKSPLPKLIHNIKLSG